MTGWLLFQMKSNLLVPFPRLEVKSESRVMKRGSSLHREPTSTFWIFRKVAHVLVIGMLDTRTLDLRLRGLTRVLM